MKNFLKIFLAILLIVCVGAALASCNENESESDVNCEHSYDNACDANCNSCGEARVVGEHIASADDGDCTTDIKCSVCEKVLVAGKTQHVSSADDGDCTTAVTCTECDHVITAAKAHDFTGTWQNDATDHWHICANAGCNASDTKTAHAMGADGTCTECGRIMQECVNHEYTITKYDENDHWKECACGDKQAVVAHDLSTEGNCTTGYHCNGCDWVSPAKNHTPAADDGDCTTEVKCSACGEVAVAGNNAHIPSTEGSCTEGLHCAESGCNWISEPKAHTPEADDGDCTTSIKCSACEDIVVTGKQSHVDSNDDDKCDECNKPMGISNGNANTEGGWGALIRP